MNAHLVKLALTLCSISLLNLFALRAQDTNDNQVPPPPGYGSGAGQPGGFGGRGGMQPRGFGGGPMGSTEDTPTFDIQIENGTLSLAPLAGHSELTNFWKPGTKTVPATMENISRYLRAVDTNLNVILSPGTGDFTISDLKLKTSSLRSIPDAISIASGGDVRASSGSIGMGRLGGPNGRPFGESTLSFTSRDSANHSAMEVFNLSGYIQTLYFQMAGHADDKYISQKLDELQNLILATMRDMGIYKSSSDAPNFRYHSGTKLLIVIGKPEAIEVTRKIINALPGQTKVERNLPLDTPQSSGQN